jgi:DNA (cytosine-5)-methyltransferase 1
VRRPRLLDLFCGQGGAGAGYWLAGFDVVGVDIKPQSRYPFEFIQADVLEFLAAGGAQGFDVVHASPPCQLFTSLRALAIGSGSRVLETVSLIEPTRELLRAWGGVYVIENVPGAPLETPVRICGSSLGMDLRRHRLFESNATLMTPPCAHGWQTPRFEVCLGMPNSRSDGKDRVNPLSTVVSVVGNSVIAAEARRAMGMPWATRDGCSRTTSRNERRRARSCRAMDSCQRCA